MRSILTEVNSNANLKPIWLDREKLMNSLGIDIENRKFIDLSTVDNQTLADLEVKSLMWIETVNEILATTEKLEKDLELEIDTQVNRALKAAPSSTKVTEARSAAKSTDDYVRLQKGLNTVSAYAKYLSRLLDNLEKVHYTIKGRSGRMAKIERKY